MSEALAHVRLNGGVQPLDETAQEHRQRCNFPVALDQGSNLRNSHAWGAAPSGESWLFLSSSPAVYSRFRKMDLPASPIGPITVSPSCNATASNALSGRSLRSS